MGSWGGDMDVRSDPAGRPVTARGVPRHRKASTRAGAGVEGNAKLTAMTGALLLLGFAVEGVTVLEVRKLLVAHIVVGALLIGPVLLKIASTTYRFMRYYTGAPPYVRKGPPAPLLRVLGPLVIATSVAVLGTGIMLSVAGPGTSWLFLHKASFIAWFAVMTVHVLNYAPRLPAMLAARSGHDHGEGRRGAGAASAQPVPGSPARWLLLVASLAIGVVVAAVAMHLSVKWGVSF